MPAALHSTIALLQSSSLTSVVQQEIERAILAGDYAPGSKLNEAALAQKLGVSRGPVREAFRMLDEAGLVRSEKNRGVFVRAIPIDEALEIFDLRAAMDEWVGKRLAEGITPEQLKELKALLAEMDKAVQAQDARRYHLANLRFHDRMVEMVGNGKLTDTYRRLTRELSLFRRQNLADSGSMRSYLAEHKKIVKAIAAGDVAGAAQAMLEHVMQSKQRTLANDVRQRALAASAAPR